MPLHVEVAAPPHGLPVDTVATSKAANQSQPKEHHHINGEVYGIPPPSTRGGG